jgi:hypothetical protein
MAGRWRTRLWINQRQVHDVSESNGGLDECTLGQLHQFVGGDRAEAIPGAGQALADSMTKPGDRWVFLLEDRAGLYEPIVTGNSPAFANRVLREEYGLKLPEGELSIQARKGIRVPPEYQPPPPDI